MTELLPTIPDGEIYHPESADKKLAVFSLDSLPDDVRRTELPQIKDYFSTARIKEARKNIRQALFEIELLAVAENGAQTSFCLLNLPGEWVIDSARRIVLHAPRNKREYSTLPATFPKIFISKTAAKYAGESPLDAVNSLIADEAERMLYESGAARSLDEFELADFRLRLTFHLTLVCRGFFQKNGAVLLWKLARAVHSKIPASALRFALLLRGPHADAMDVTIIWQNLEAVTEIFEISPAVLPIFIGALRQRAARLSGSDALGASAGFLRSHWLRLDMRAPGGDILKMVEKTWFGDNLQPAAWSWICSRRYVWGQSLFHKCSDAARQALWLNLMARLDVQPKLTVYRALLPVFVEMCSSLHFTPARFSLDAMLLASFIEYANGKHRSELSSGCIGELQDALVWWSEAKPTLRKKRKWEWFQSHAPANANA